MINDQETIEFEPFDHEDISNNGEIDDEVGEEHELTLLRPINDSLKSTLLSQGDRIILGEKDIKTHSRKNLH